MESNTARRFVALLLAATPAVFAGCATTAAPLPRDATAIYCVSPESDCGSEAMAACPYGYRTLDKKSWEVGHRESVTDEIAGTDLRNASPAIKYETRPRVQRTKLVIECNTAT